MSVLKAGLVFLEWHVATNAGIMHANIALHVGHDSQSLLEADKCKQLPHQLMCHASRCHERFMKRVTMRTIQLRRSPG